MLSPGSNISVHLRAGRFLEAPAGGRYWAPVQDGGSSFRARRLARLSDVAASLEITVAIHFL